MSSASSVPAIHGEISINVPVERVFNVFTSPLRLLWPRDFLIGQADITGPALW